LSKLTIGQKRVDGAATSCWRLAPRYRKAILGLHIISAGGLVGATAGVIVLSLRAATAGHADAHALYESGLALAFILAIPSSFASLLTGLLLGLGTAWGVLRYYWVVAKLALLIAIILMGALAVGPGLDHLADDSAAGLEMAGLGDLRHYLTMAGAANLAFILGAIGLSVFKPWGRIRPIRRTGAATRPWSQVNQPES
jgi:hypothetical protein